MGGRVSDEPRSRRETRFFEHASPSTLLLPRAADGTRIASALGVEGDVGEEPTSSKESALSTGHALPSLPGSATPACDDDTSPRDRRQLKLAAFTALAIQLAQFATVPALANTPPPNVIILLADDLGYADLGCYGSDNIATPNLDALAARGVRLTRYYAPSSVCSASRAGLLTGCYPPRIGIKGVISANAKYGIASNETLLSELLKAKGYATAIYGKWHLGNQPRFWPRNHGFDDWFGTIGSNDMGRGRPSLEQRRLGLAGVELVDRDHVAETNPDQTLLTKRYTDRAVQFIAEQNDRPFFLYVAYNMPHTPLFASSDFEGHSQRGLYGDTVEEIDASVGRIREAVQSTDQLDNTLIVFTSDNGPWLIFGNHGGSAGTLAGGKKQTLEGGFRVPCIASCPAHIAQGVSTDALVSGVDWLPTIAALAGADLPSQSIDGENRLEALKNPATALETARCRPVPLFYEDELRALVTSRWKLQFEHVDTQTPDPNAIGHEGQRGEVTTVKRPSTLYDLQADPSESHDVSSQHPHVVQRLTAAAQTFRKQLGDTLSNVAANSQRQPGRITNRKHSTNRN